MSALINPSPPYLVSSTLTNVKAISNCSASAVTVGISVEYPDAAPASFNIVLNPGQTFSGICDITSVSAPVVAFRAR
jgi:hypothetical protein